ncbi:MAG: zinc ribbon domain-containing protein [Firmicutes bacterium]|nr:zinc ribbon domain-containing protein [Bacillota bacterium]
MQDLKNTLFNITKSVSKTSGDLLKSTKLSMNLSTEENNLKNLYSEIGKKVHEIYQYGGSLGKFFDEKYLEIEASERKIADIKEQISVIKGTRICSKCGKNVDRTAEFCQKCGIRVELGYAPAEEQTHSTTSQQSPAQEYDFTPSPAPPQPVLPPAAQEPALRICRVCNYKNEVTAKFCLSCGRILE